MLSGVPQGSILGPFLFLLYINDLPDVISNGSAIALFADDAKCSHIIRNSEDSAALQKDLDNLFNWTNTWGLSYNLKKCESMRISRKRASPVACLTDSPYVLGGHSLSLVPSQKDLGVTVTNKMTWSLDTSVVVAKANRMLGFLRRHCSAHIGPDRKKLLYLTFVRSHLSYVSASVKCHRPKATGRGAVASNALHLALQYVP